MRGDATLSVRGKILAGIATQVVVERVRRRRARPPSQLGREQYVERVWDWVRRYKRASR